MSNFTAQQIQNYRNYEYVRAGGQYNMFDPRAMAATGLNKDEYLFVMQNFSELKEAANSTPERVLLNENA
jgi:hypothetical protein